MKHWSANPQRTIVIAQLQFYLQNLIFTISVTHQHHEYIHEQVLWLNVVSLWSWNNTIRVFSTSVWKGGAAARGRVREGKQQKKRGLKVYNLYFSHLIIIIIIIIIRFPRGVKNTLRRANANLPPPPPQNMPWLCCYTLHWCINYISGQTTGLNVTAHRKYGCPHSRTNLIDHILEQE